MTVMNLSRTGSGRPAVVLVHGFACSQDDWRAQVADLSRSFDTITVDLRGHGATGGSPEDCRISVYGADIASLVEELGIGPAVLVGHSMGCRAILEAQRVAPSCAAALVLVDGSRLGQPGQRIDEQMARRIEEMGYATFAETFFRDMFLPTSDPGLVDSAVKQALRLPASHGLALFTDMIRWDASNFDAAVAAVKVPLLAIQSTRFNDERRRVPMRRDETTPYLDLLKDKVAGSRVDIVENVGHFPQIEAPEAVNAAIRGLIDKHFA